MSSYISHLEVHPHGVDQKSLLSQGFNKIDFDLNKGAEGDARHLWYKRGSSVAPLTRIQLTFNIEMSVGLINAGYRKVNWPIRAAPKVNPIYIWYAQGSGEYDTPIVGLDITSTAADEAQRLSHGWEKLACDLNRNAGGDWLFIWVKREKPTYICDVTVTDSFKSNEEYFRDGYIRVDEDARRGAGREYIFIWYRQTTDPDRALCDLKVSATEGEFQALQQQNYQPVNVNFHEWIGSHAMYLWYKRDRSVDPIKTVTLLINTAAISVYKKAGINVEEKSLNTGTKGRPVYLCFK